MKPGGVSPGPDITGHAASVPGTPDRGPSELAEAIEHVERMAAWNDSVLESLTPGGSAHAFTQAETVALRTVIEAARTQLTEPEPVYPYLAAPSGAAHEKEVKE